MLHSLALRNLEKCIGRANTFFLFTLVLNGPQALTRPFHPAG